MLIHKIYAIWGDLVGIRQGNRVENDNLFCCCNSFTPTQLKTQLLVLDLMQENKGMDEGNRGSHARPEMKINAGGAGGSHPHGNGENGDHGTLGGGGGGAAFIPLYAAGAANSHHPNQHHSSSNGCSKWDRLHTFGAAASTATLVLYMYT